MAPKSTSTSSSNVQTESPDIGTKSQNIADLLSLLKRMESVNLTPRQKVKLLGVVATLIEAYPETLEIFAPYMKSMSEESN